jgi:hypothetical protein
MKIVPTHLINQRLDVAERVLHDAGIAYRVIRLHSHAGGTTSGWGVCETTPHLGARVSSAPIDLIVVHARCGAG